MRTLTRLTLTLAVSLLIARGGMAALVGHWAMDDGTGPTASDSTTYSNDGAISGASWVVGKLGGGLDFNPSNNNIVTVGNHSSLNITGALTLAAWVNYDTISSYPRIVEKATSTGLTPYGMTLQGAGNVVFRIGNDEWSVNTNLPANQWHHVTGTYDGTDMKVYVNGGEVVSRTRTGTGLYSSTHAVHIGNSDSLNRGLDGTLDDVRIYDEALDAAAVETLASMADGGYAAAVKATNPGIYYRLREPAGRAHGSPVHNSGTEGATLDGTWGFADAGYSASVPVSGVAGPRPSDTINGRPLNGLEWDNTAARFEGYVAGTIQSKDLINIGANPSFLQSDELTYSMLFKTESTDGWMRMIVTDPTAGNQQFQLIMHGGQLILVTGTANGAGGAAVSAPAGDTGSTHYNDDQWHHLVAVRKGATFSDLALYMDGSEVELHDWGIGSWTQGYSARIGGWSTNAASGFVGLMDEVAIWDRALTAGEAGGLYNALIPEPSSMLLLLLGACALVGVQWRR